MNKKQKKKTINPINKRYKKCFQYAATVALNHEEIGKHAERITKIKPFIKKYIWEGINFPLEKDDWKNIEKNNVTIVEKCLRGGICHSIYWYAKTNNTNT